MAPSACRTASSRWRSGSAHEQEVADVHARDEQNDADDDHEQRCAQADEAPATRIRDPTYRFCHDRRQRFR